MKKSITRLAAALLMSVMTLSACGGGTTGGEEAAVTGEAEAAAAGEEEAVVTGGGELVIAIPDEIEGTDVQQINWENVCHTLLFEPLIAYDLNLQGIVVDQAAAFSVSEDELTLEFKLLDDAKFSDGAPITADAVKRAYERYLEISPYGSDWACVTGMEAPDDKTLLIHMSEPSAYFIPSLACTYGGVVNPDVTDAMENDEFHRKAVSNGLFGVDEWVQGSELNLVRNEGFKTNYADVENKGPAHLEKVKIRFIPEAFTRIAELEAGTVDVVYDIPTENLDGLRNNPDIDVYEYLQSGVSYMAFNVERAPFDDMNVRKALAMALDRDALNATLGNNVLPTYGYASPAQVCYDPGIEDDVKAKLGFDVEAAKALLAEAGWVDTDGDGIVDKDGAPLSFELAIPLDRPVIKMIGPIVQEQFQAIGVKAEIREYEYKYVSQITKDKDFDVAIRTYTWIDPDILSYVFGDGDITFWHDPAIDAKMAEARYIMDEKERAAAYREIQNDIADICPGVGLFSENYYIAMRNTIKGFKLSADGKSYYNDVTKE